MLLALVSTLGSTMLPAEAQEALEELESIEPIAPSHNINVEALENEAILPPSLLVPRSPSSLFLAELDSPVERLRQRPATTVDEWMQQMAQSVVQVTGVQVNPTDTGVEVVLETAEGQLADPVTSVVGNALIADIPNAVLALPDREEFQAASPAEGIALVSVTPRGDSIRVAITGNDAPPAAEVRTETQGLVLSVTPGTEIIGTEDDAIQVVVTATRTEEPLNRIPRSVTVIDRDDLDTQTSLPQSFRELLGREVPGFNPPSPQGDDRGLLRGRDVSYLIDGVPVGSGFARSQRQIGLDAIE